MALLVVTQRLAATPQVTVASALMSLQHLLTLCASPWIFTASCLSPPSLRPPPPRCF